MNEKKKLVILSADAGYGHRIAANAVRQAVEEKYGDSVEVVIINLLNDPKTPKILKNTQTEYDKVVQLAPELYHIGYQASDGSISTNIGERALSVLLFNAVRKMIKEEQPDAILSTYPLYQAALVASFEMTGVHIPTLMVITDLVTVHQLWYNRWVDYCLVPTEIVAEQAEIAGVSPDAIHLTGIPVNPEMSQKPEDITALRESLGWEADRTTFLAVGSKRVKRLMPMLDVLNHYGGNIQLAVVCGNDEEIYQALKGMDWHIPVHLYQYVENMAPFYHASDVMVCKAGGLVTTESLACGLPILIIEAIPGQEEGNASYVVDHQAGAFVKTPIEALQTIHHWLMNDGARLLELKGNAKALGHPDAAYQAAELAHEAMHQEKARQRSYNYFPNANLVSGVKRVQEDFKQANVEQKLKILLWKHENFQAYLRGLESNLKNQIIISRKIITQKLTSKNITRE